MNEAKNRSGLKSLDRFEKDPRVESIEKDSDGIWIYLADGYCFDIGGPHSVHEHTVRECLYAMRYRIERCECRQCSPTFKKFIEVKQAIYESYKANDLDYDFESYWTGAVDILFQNNLVNQDQYLELVDLIDERAN